MRVDDLKGVDLDLWFARAIDLKPKKPKEWATELDIDINSLTNLGFNEDEYYVYLKIYGHPMTGIAASKLYFDWSRVGPMIELYRININENEKDNNFTITCFQKTTNEGKLYYVEDYNLLRAIKKIVIKIKFGEKIKEINYE